MQTPETPQVLLMTQEMMTAAAKTPIDIGRLMVDMAQVENEYSLEGCGLYFEHENAPRQQLAAYRTGMEEFTTGGWVRCITPKKLLAKERKQLDQAARAGDLTILGQHRGVLMVWFHARKEPTNQARQSGLGFAQGVG